VFGVSVAMVHSGNDSALLAIEISGDFVAGSMELLRWKQITCLLRRDTVLLTRKMRWRARWTGYHREVSATAAYRNALTTTTNSFIAFIMSSRQLILLPYSSWHVLLANDCCS